MRQNRLALALISLLVLLNPVDPFQNSASSFENTIAFRVAHASLQFTDTPKQHTHDIRKLFNQDFDLITGTEAGASANNTADELRRLGEKYGYRIKAPGRSDTWVAVKKSLIVPGSWSSGFRKAIHRSAFWSDKGITWGRFRNVNLGWVSLGSVHNLPYGGIDPTIKLRSDKRYARIVGEWSSRHSAGTSLSFLAGDFNRSDRFFDLFFGQPRTTCWDELKRWPSTGHGNIDAISSFDWDDRASCTRARALDDKEFFLHTDHFLVVSTYKIRLLR